MAAGTTRLYRAMPWLVWSQGGQKLRCEAGDEVRREFALKVAGNVKVGAIQGELFRTPSDSGSGSGDQLSL